MRLFSFPLSLWLIAEALMRGAFTNNYPITLLFVIRYRTVVVRLCLISASSLCYSSSVTLLNLPCYSTANTSLSQNVENQTNRYKFHANGGKTKRIGDIRTSMFSYFFFIEIVP